MCYSGERALSPTIALMRVAASLALDEKMERMRQEDCIDKYKTDYDWSQDKAKDYAELCPSRMESGRGTTPSCKHWEFCFRALWLRKATNLCEDENVPFNVFAEVRERVTHWLLSRGAWREDQVKPTPGRESVVEFIEMVHTRLDECDPSDAADVLLQIYKEIGGCCIDDPCPTGDNDA